MANQPKGALPKKLAPAMSSSKGNEKAAIEQKIRNQIDANRSRTTYAKPNGAA